MQLTTFMTRDPVTIESDASLRAALTLMDEHGLRHLPVMRDGRVAGVISDRDLLEATGGVAGDESEGTSVEAIMHSPAVTAHPDDSVVTVAVEVVLRGIGCVPVVDDGSLVGIVTEMDLLRLFVEASQEKKLSGEVDPPIQMHMTKRVVTLSAADTVAEAISVRNSVDIRHLPVVGDGRLVGIVSDRDLRRARGAGRIDGMSVEEVMVRDVMTLGPDDHLSAAARIMTEHRISALPVVEDSALVGILSTTDLLDHCMNTLRLAE